MSTGSIRSAEPRDAAAIAALHAELIPSSLWAELGLGFLTRLYTALLEDSRFVSFVYEVPDGISAFLAASTDTAGLLRATAKQSGPSLAIRALPRMRPALLARIVETGRYPQLRGASGAGESLFCAVRPALRRRGIGASFHDELERAFLDRGIDRMIVTTEANNTAGQRHLEAIGFHEDGRFAFYGKPMVRYEKRIREPDQSR